jgi:hypothetical protein
VSGSCKDDNDLSGCIEGGEFVDLMSDSQKEWSQLLVMDKLFVHC